MSLRDAWPPSAPAHPHKAALGPVLEKPVRGQFLAAIIFHSFWNFPTWFSVSSMSPLGDLEEGQLGGRKSCLKWPQCTSAVPRALWVLLETCTTSEKGGHCSLHFTYRQTEAQRG